MDTFERDMIQHEKAEVARRALSSSIAMRIAFSVFVVNKDTRFSFFQDRWEQATRLCSDSTPFVELVLTEILQSLGNKRILIIADELIQTGKARSARNHLFKSLREVQKSGRIVVSSLKPRQLPLEASYVPTVWVQLRHHSPNDIQQVADACEWIRNADLATKFHALYSFSIPSTNWRAIEHLFVKYNGDSPSGDPSPG